MDSDDDEDEDGDGDATPQTALSAALAGGHLDVARLLVVEGGARASLVHPALGPVHALQSTVGPPGGGPPGGARGGGWFGDRPDGLALVRLLVERGGADPDGASAWDDRTALHAAAHHAASGPDFPRQPRDAIFRYLVGRGAGRGVRAGSEGWTDRHRCAPRLGAPTLRWLVEAGGLRLDARCGRGATLLHVCDRPDAIRYLVEEGGLDVDAPDAAGARPLHRRARGGVDAARALRALGADVAAVDALGRTPLHVAVEAGGRWEMVSFLASSGAPLGARDAGGRTPLAVALAGGGGPGDPSDRDVVVALLRSLDAPE